MTVDTFRSVGNVHIVPVLRNRLAFAITMRRALAAQEAIRPWGERDLIAVALPPSISEALREGIALLPRVSLLFGITSGQRGREVLAVTPCDGMIEAVRTADEHGWPLEFVDLEVAPGNLQRDACVRDPDWPDDTLALAVGVQRYMKMIEGYFAQPPARLEPLDSLRERHIAERVRRFQPFHDRIILVCDAGLANAIHARIERPLPANAAASARVPPKISFKLVQQLNMEVLLSYLDDYPQLVERFEKQRRHRDISARFDKLAMLTDAVLECDARADDLVFSTRQHQAFSQFLHNLLRHERRIVPTPDVLFYVAQSCFNHAFAERLHCFLSSYGEQVKVERVRPRSTATQSTFTYTLDVKAAKSGLSSRTCHPTPPRYTDTREQQKSNIGKSKNDVAHHWLPEYRFLENMHQRVRRATAFAPRPRRSAIEYRGSAEMGIDTRATLRSAIRPRPHLYVKAHLQTRRPVDTRGEPIVWILSDQYAGSGLFHAGSIDRRTDPEQILTGNDDTPDFPIGTLDVFIPRNEYGHNRFYSILSYNESRTGKIIYAERCGWINFGWDYKNEKEARAVLGDIFNARFPNHKFYHDPRDKSRQIGCVDPDFRDLQVEGTSWRDIALMTALKYAKAAILVAAPGGFVVPARASAYAAGLGKSIHVVSTDFLTRSDRDKFRTHYIYYSPAGRDLAAETNFSILMRGRWD